MGAPPPWVEEAARLRGDRLTYQAVADALGQSKAAVYYWLNDAQCRRLSLAWKRRHGYVKRPTPAGKTSSSAGAMVSDMPRTSPSTRITVRVPQLTASTLRAVAERDGTTISKEVRGLIEQRVRDALAAEAGQTA